MNNYINSFCQTGEVDFAAVPSEFGKQIDFFMNRLELKFQKYKFSRAELHVNRKLFINV